jgi:hypothetical protein
MSICRAVQVLGLPLYHISQYVASTFKCLATTTTNYDLNNLYQHRRGNLPSHDTAYDPIHRPYSDCRIVSIQLLPVLLAEHLFDKDSGTLHRFLVSMHLGFHFNS